MDMRLPMANHVSVWYRMNRERLRDGSLIEEARKQATANYSVYSDGEIEESLQRTLRNRPSIGDMWVFGYGSLIWNPTMDYDEKCQARLYGWHRSFCVASLGRGTEVTPAVMLGLDVGGSCHGMAFRICASNAEDELRLLWYREVLSDVYQPRWLTISLSVGRVSALTFVANRNHARYVGGLHESEIVELIAFAVGPLGACREYLDNTVSALKTSGLSDIYLVRLHAAVQARLAAKG